MIQSSNQSNTNTPSADQNKAQPAGVGPQQTDAEKAKALADKAKADASNMKV